VRVKPGRCDETTDRGRENRKGLNRKNLGKRATTMHDATHQERGEERMNGTGRKASDEKKLTISGDSVGRREKGDMIVSECREHEERGKIICYIKNEPWKLQKTQKR